MTSLLLAFVFKFFIPLLVLVALVDILSATQAQKIRRLSLAGNSQRAIAEQLGITRYKVRLALA
jgi:cell division septal protein FtsQ